MNDSSLFNAPPRPANDARNLFIVTLPSLLGLFGLLGLILLETLVSQTFVGNYEPFWGQLTHGVGPSLCHGLTCLQ
jgi:hypothetical protein